MEQCKAIHGQAEAGEITLYIRIEQKEVVLCYLKNAASNANGTDGTVEKPLSPVEKLEKQDTRNKEIALEKTVEDTKKQILSALNIRDVKDADAEYNKYVKGDMLMNVDGTLTENTDGFSISFEKEAKENNRLHVFVCEVDGETKYVVPVYGAGLRGSIWGYVALIAY